MSEKHTTQWRILLSIGMACFLLWGGAFGRLALCAETEAEQVAQWLEKAQASFERQEFIASYEACRKALAIDPLHQAAREKVYEIATIYKVSEEAARKEQDDAQANMLQRQHRMIVRDMLNMFTLQLEQRLGTYSEYNTRAKQGENMQEKIEPALRGIITVLQQLKFIYEEFPRDSSKTDRMVERINKTLATYEQELAAYRQTK